MRPTTTFVVLRSIVALLVGALAVVSFANGRVVLGVIFAGLAITNVALTVTMQRRRSELARRFPGRRGGGRGWRGREGAESELDQSAGA